MKKESEYFEIRNGNGIISGADRSSVYTTKEAALKSAKKFKENPLESHGHMTSENVKYWKAQEYTIVKKTVITEELITI